MYDWQWLKHIDGDDDDDDDDGDGDGDGNGDDDDYDDDTGGNGRAYQQLCFKIDYSGLRYFNTSSV